jgi:hypothetical protein
VFTPKETQDLNARLNAMQPTQRAQAVAQIKTAAGPNWQLVAKGLGDDDQMIGSTMAVGNPSTARDIALGASLMTPTTGKGIGSPPASKTQNVMASYAGTLDNSLILRNQAAVNAVYVKRAMDAGKDPTSASGFDSDLYKKAADDVLGKAVRYGSGTVVAPPGMDESTFLNRLDTGFNTLGLQGKQLRDNIRTGDYKMQRTSLGNYMVINAAGRPVTVNAGDRYVNAVFNLED